MIDQIKCLGRGPLVIPKTLAQARRQAEGPMECLKTERVSLVGQLRKDLAKLGRLAASSTPGDSHLVE